MSENPAKLVSLTFSGLRRLNAYTAFEKSSLGNWRSGETTYQFGAINILAGVNGGGKSTVIDAIDFLRCPDKISGLPRENRTTDSVCLFEFSFSNGAALCGNALPCRKKQWPSAPNLKEEIDIQGVEIFLLEGTGGTSGAFAKNIHKHSLDDISRGQLAKLTSYTGCKVTYWEREREVSALEAAELLVDAGPILTGLASDPAADYSSMGFEQGHIEALRQSPVFCREGGEDEEVVDLYHSDDLHQSNRVQKKLLPSGWKQVVSLISFLKKCDEHSICLIEEPETHLHPKLQRYLIKIMEAIASERQLQLFIATHSTTLQSRFAWKPESDVCYFEATGDRLHIGINQRRLLDDLGISGAELSVANGVVWVEGPSDRLYLNHWMRLYCETNKTTMPREHVDFVFAYHGGALLSHLAIRENGDDHRTNILRLNRNFAVVMDRDLDFDGSTTGKKPSAKEEIINCGKDIPSCAALLTPGYTIESCIPGKLRREYFRTSAGRLQLKKGTKVGVAMLYLSKYSDWNKCFDTRCSPEVLVTSLLDVIRKWSS